MPRRVELYDLKAGAVLKRDVLTAQEAVANDAGRYALAKPEVWPPKKADEPSAPADAPAAAVASPAGAVAGADGPTDDLTAIDGIGPGIARRLAAAGLGTFAALAASTPDAIVAAIRTPGFNAKKVADENWIGQAAAKVAA